MIRWSQRDRGNLRALDPHLFYDQTQQVLALVEIALFPHLAKIAKHAQRFLQHRARQRVKSVHLLLKLRSLLQVFFFADKTVVPSQIQPFDDLLDFLRACLTNRQLIAFDSDYENAGTRPGVF